MIHACCLLAFKILERKKIHECIHIKCLRGMVVWFELTQEVDNLVRAAGYISSSILKFRVMNTNCLAVTCCRPGFGSPRTPCMKEICLGTDVMQNLSIFSILSLHHKIDRWNVNCGFLSKASKQTAYPDLTSKLVKHHIETTCTVFYLLAMDVPTVRCV